MIDGKVCSAFPGESKKANLTRDTWIWALAIQQVTEDVVIQLAETARKLTGSRFLVMAGGVALNCVANGKLLRRRTFEDIWIQPAAGDAGGALGQPVLLGILGRANPEKWFLV